MIQGSAFNLYEKRVYSCQRRLKKPKHHYRLPRPEIQQLCKMPVFKACGEKVFLTRKTDDSRFLNIKKNQYQDDNKLQSRHKMVLVAKKIGMFIETPIYLQAYQQDRRLDKMQDKRDGKKMEIFDDKKQIKQLQSTKHESELRISRFQPSIIQQNKSLLSQSNPKTFGCITQDFKQQTKHFSFVILARGNNEQLVRLILSRKKNWKQINKGQGIPNFRWLAGQYDSAVFQKSKSTALVKKAVNQFQFHQQITTKNGLIRNLQIFTQTKKLQLFSMTPITFIVDFDEEYCDFNLRQFLNFFMKNSPKHKQSEQSCSPSKSNYQSYQRINNFIEKLKPYFNPHPELRKKLNPLSKPDMKSQYINGDSYMWLLKPTGLNRGRGIQLFDNLDDLETFLINYLHLSGRKPVNELQVQRKKQSLGNISTLPSLVSSTQTKKASPQQFILKSCSFVIQKYIQKPLLLNGRKFDIRVWVFLNYDFSLYFFKQGYLRLSSQMFSLDVNNYFVHLTNNAIQKYSKQYGAIEKGNQVSFKSFQEHLVHEGRPNQFQNILSKIKQISYTSLNSVKNKLNPKQQKYCFQLFGFDYIIDSNYKVWLIEVNNNPCIELSSPLLQQLIPRMLNDAFKMSLDKVFGTKDVDKQQKQQGQKPQTYSVDGYQDNENMWQQLGKLYPNSEYIPK